MKRIDRHIFTEVMWPFVAAQAVFVVMFIGTEALTEATKLIARYGLPWHGVVKLLLLRIPWAIGWTMPMSVGMAVILAVGRICKDVEYTPMVIGGMSYRRMLLPLLVFATLVSGFAFFIQEYLGPKTMMTYYIRKLQLQSQAQAKQFEVHMRLNDRDSSRRVTLDAAQLDPRKPQSFKEVQVSVWSASGMPETIAFSRAAQWHPDLKQMELQDGVLLRFPPRDGPPVSSRFTAMTVNQIAGEGGFGDGFMLEASPNQIAVSSTEKPDYLTYADIRAHVRHLADSGATRREVNRIKAYIYKRATLSFSCIVFLVIGAALAVRPQRGQALGTAFAMGVALLLTYYILWNATGFLAEGSRFPGLMCWSTNIIGLIIGAILTARVPD